MHYLLFLIFLVVISASDNNTFEDNLEIRNSAKNDRNDQINKEISSGEWSPCSRSCGGGISRQPKRCRRKPCKSRPWNSTYKVCNMQPCDKPFDFRSEQCSDYNDIPYNDQLLKWYPYYDPSRPCALICRGKLTKEQLRIMNKSLLTNTEEYEAEESIIVELANKVQDGTKCYPDSQDICLNGECMRVGCDMKVGSNKNRDTCGICGGDGSTCKYAWALELTSDCSELCGGGFKIATSVCKTTGLKENIVDDFKCGLKLKPNKILLPCNIHPCSTKWLTGEWSKCSVSCGGGSRNRVVFCIEENGNATSKLPDYKCSTNHKPKYQEICNAFSCPVWEAGEWSECSVSCGLGSKRRNIECRDYNGQLSDNCDPLQKPRQEQECKIMTNIDCSNYAISEPLIHTYPSEPLPEKLIDQPVPSQSTFVPEEWTTCSVTCGEGLRHREVHCKIFLEFSRTIAKLPDHQCSGLKPMETEICSMKPCNIMENNLAYRIDTVGDSSYAESSLTDSFKSSSSTALSGGSGSGYENNVKVAPGSPVKTSYSWKELGYTDCSATCLGGVQDLIITCIRDDTRKTVMPLLCSAETKPESRIRVCNDHPCPPRWNTSEFSPCMSPCGLGIQTREVSCIHEVTRGTGNTVAVPNHMCPQPPPVDRQYCNVWDCPVEWHVSDWGKCSMTCGGGIKKRKVSCEQVMAQGRKQSRPESDCSSSKPRSEKECNTPQCNQLSPIQPIITIKNTTYIQNELEKKINLDIGGQAMIFQGTPVIKIRCPVKKFDKAHIMWKKDDEQLRKSRKYKINKKGALKIVELDFSDSGIYSCWAGQTHAVIHVTIKPKSRDLMNNEEVLRSGNAVHQRQGTPLIAEPFYGIFGEDSQGSRQENQKSTKTSQKSRKKKQKQVENQFSNESTGKYDYSITPLHQPVESTASSSASTLIPHFNHIITTLKNYWEFNNPVSSKFNQANFVTYPRNDVKNNISTTMATVFNFPLYNDDNLKKSNQFQLTRGRYNLFRAINTAIPDKIFGPDEERVFIDDDPFETEEKIFSIEHKNISAHFKPTVTLLNYQTQQKDTRHYHNNTENYFDKNQKNTQNKEEIQENFYLTEELNENKQVNFTDTLSDMMNNKSLENFNIEDRKIAITISSIYFNLTDPSHFVDILTERNKTIDSRKLINESSIETRNNELITTKITTTMMTIITDSNNSKIQENKKNIDQLRKSEIINMNKEIDKTIRFFKIRNKNLTSIVLGNEAKDHKPTIGSITIFSKAKDNLIFEWITTDWSKCSQTCGGEGFQMRGAQCTVRAVKSESNASKIPHRTIIGASLCENANYPMPEKVRPCGSGKCPQWHSGPWTHCETSRCFNWKTAMQRRDISCRLIEESEDKLENSTNIEPSKCDEGTRPPQRQECYNDACKGVWRVGEWSECSASCEKDGIKYRILQCVWFGTKKAAGNVCGDMPRPPVMKTCRGPSCSKSFDDCKDHSQLCNRVKLLGMCHMSLYKKQCCKSCQQDRYL